MWGGAIVKDTSREFLEDIITYWDLMDIKPKKGKYTWYNKRLGIGNISPIFLVSCSYLEEDLEISPSIIYSVTSNLKPISMSMTLKTNFGHLPFNFNPCWLTHLEVAKIIKSTWQKKRKALQVIFGKLRSKLSDLH